MTKTIGFTLEQTGSQYEEDTNKETKILKLCSIQLIIKISNLKMLTREFSNKPVLPKKGFDSSWLCNIYGIGQ